MIKQTDILDCEFDVLDCLRFDLVLFHPYRPLTLYVTCGISDHSFGHPQLSSYSTQLNARRHDDGCVCV